jgi:hypothetical protein
MRGPCSTPINPLMGSFFHADPHIVVWVFAIIVAVDQIGIAATLVNTLFIAVVGSAALALAGC